MTFPIQHLAAYDPPSVDRQTQEAQRWEHMGELWAEEQFGNTSGRDAALRQLAGKLYNSRSLPTQEQWNRLVFAYENRWMALRRDWIVRRSHADPKPHLYKALGFSSHL